MRATNRSGPDGPKLGHVVLLVMLSVVTSLVVLNGLMLIKTEAAQRRGRNWDGYPNLGGIIKLRQTALNAGYNEGSKKVEGITISERSKTSGDFKSYENADQDYSSKLGSGDSIKDIFRMAFESGYRVEILHRREIETAIKTIATMIGVENTGDEIGADMTHTVTIANCAKLH